MPAPCKFISTGLPFCSVIRPISTAEAGAKAAVASLAASGLFDGQSDGFFNLLADLAEEADSARREG
jgi:hypothetical protein